MEQMFAMPNVCGSVPCTSRSRSQVQGDVKNFNLRHQRLAYMWTDDLIQSKVASYIQQETRRKTVHWTILCFLSLCLLLGHRPPTLSFHPFSFLSPTFITTLAPLLSLSSIFFFFTDKARLRLYKSPSAVWLQLPPTTKQTDRCSFCEWLVLQLH